MTDVYMQGKEEARAAACKLIAATAAKLLEEEPEDAQHARITAATVNGLIASILIIGGHDEVAHLLRKMTKEYFYKYGFEKAK